MPLIDELNTAVNNGDCTELRQLLNQPADGNDIRAQLWNSFESDNLFAKYIETILAKLIDQIILKAAAAPNKLLSAAETPLFIACIQKIEALNVVTFTRVGQDKQYAILLLDLVIAYTQTNFTNLEPTFKFVLSKLKDEELNQLALVSFNKCSDISFTKQAKERYKEFLGFLFTIKPSVKENFVKQCMGEFQGGGRKFISIKVNYDSVLQYEKNYKQKIRLPQYAFGVMIKCLAVLMAQSQLNDRQKTIFMTIIFQALALDNKMRAKIPAFIALFNKNERAKFLRLPALQRAFTTTMYDDPNERDVVSARLTANK